MRRPQQVHFIPIPMEMWKEIYKYLKVGDIRNLALVARCVGAFAQTYLLLLEGGKTIMGCASSQQAAAQDATVCPRLSFKK